MRYLIALALLTIACGGAEARSPNAVWSDPRPGFDQSPLCGSAFAWEITEQLTASDDSGECAGIVKPGHPEWPSTRIIRIDGRRGDGYREWTDDVHPANWQAGKDADPCEVVFLVPIGSGGLSVTRYMTIDGDALTGGGSMSVHGDRCAHQWTITGRAIPPS